MASLRTLETYAPSIDDRKSSALVCASLGSEGEVILPFRRKDTKCYTLGKPGWLILASSFSLIPTLKALALSPRIPPSSTKASGLGLYVMWMWEPSAQDLGPSLWPPHQVALACRNLKSSRWSLFCPKSHPKISYLVSGWRIHGQPAEDLCRTGRAESHFFK
jgi:hypothetical protein